MSDKNNVPTLLDWGDYKSDMDVQDAFDMFFGKTVTEGERLIRNNVIQRTTDLRFMPVIPFKYYIQSFISVVKNKNYEKLDEPDVVSCFMDLVEEVSQRNPEWLDEVRKTVLAIIDELAEYQVLYGAKYHIYGDFSEQKDRMLRNLGVESKPE